MNVPYKLFQMVHGSPATKRFWCIFSFLSWPYKREHKYWGRFPNR